MRSYIATSLFSDVRVHPPEPSRTPLRSSAIKIRLGSRDPRTKWEFGSSRRTNSPVISLFPANLRPNSLQKAQKQEPHNRSAILSLRGRNERRPAQEHKPGVGGRGNLFLTFSASADFRTQNPADPQKSIKWRRKNYFS